MSQARVEESIRDHREMLAALAQKDAATFEAALFRHVAGGKGDDQRIFPIGRPDAPRTHPAAKGRGGSRAASRRKEAAHA
jgi:hypothetical protein